MDDLENDEINTIHNLYLEHFRQYLASLYLKTIQSVTVTLWTLNCGDRSWQNSLEQLGKWMWSFSLLTSSPSTCPYSMSSSCKVSMWSEVKAMGTSRMFFFPRSHRPLITSSVWGPSHGMGPTWMTKHRTQQQFNSGEVGTYGCRSSIWSNPFILTKILTTTAHVSMIIPVNVHGPQKMVPIDFYNLMTFSLLPPSGQTLAPQLVRL